MGFKFIGIIDWGMGNLHSVQKAVEYCGAKTKIIRDPKELSYVDKVILPGVGAFGDAIDNLKKLGLYETLLDYLENDKKVVLGICLGMQVFFEKSQEAGNKKGLGVFKGRILRFKLRDKENNLKIPHMGWNNLIIKRKNCSLLRDVPENSYVYFCHSFYPKPDDPEIICATTHYGVEFASVIQSSNIYGVQFHPEKSQTIGLKIIKNFVNL